MRIAIVQSLEGNVTCCGPDDFKEGEHPDALSAAISWHLEVGHLPAAYYWVDVQLPPLPTIPVLRGKAEAGEFPKAFIAEMDGDACQQLAREIE